MFPYLLKFSVTNKCNLNCKHCFLDKNNQVEPSLEEIDKVFTELQNKYIGCLALTGGEPMVRKDFKEIVELGSKHHIPIVIATNGTLLTDDLIVFLKMHNVNKIQISLESYNREKNDYIRGIGVFDKVISAIDKLIENRFEVTIAYTLNHYNFRDMLKMIEFSNLKKVFALRLELYLPLAQEQYHDVFALTKKDILEIYNLIEFAHTQNNHIKIKYPFMNRKGCGAGVVQGIINSNLTLSPCDLLPDIHSKKFKEIGDLTQIWNEDSIFLDWRNIKCSDSFCINDCKKRIGCHFGCRAAALAYNGHLNASDYTCIYKLKGGNSYG